MPPAQPQEDVVETSPSYSSSPVLLNVFTECTPAPSFEGLWRDPDDCSATGYASMAYWLGVARQLEAAAVDAVFFADVQGLYDVYQGSADAALRAGVQVPSIDPVLVVPAMAAVTHRLGFAVTYSTSYNAPYHCARVFSTLDHLTGGRIAWNVVTSFLGSAAQNGIGERLPHDERYDRADAYLDVTHALWETSWDDDAVRLDRAAAVFTRPDRVHPIDHESQWFSVRGPHQSAPSPQRTPVIYQAGASGRGLDFAARHAEVAFLTLGEPRRAGEVVQDLRRRVLRSGRPINSMKILQGMPVVLGHTQEEVAAKVELMQSLHSPEGRLAKWCGWTGLDLAALPPDTLVTDLDVGGTKSALEAITRIDPRRAWKVEDVLRTVSEAHRPARGGRFMLAGTPEEVADQMELWTDKADVDGFNLVPFPPSAGIGDICDLLIPELVRRGLRPQPDEPAEATLREQYFGAGARYHRAPAQLRAGA